MAGISEIEWTDATWNPIAGCKIVSPGCTNCYAMRMAARLQAMGLEHYRATTRKSGRRPVWTGKLRLNDRALSAPLKWKKPRKIFVNSMSDLFQDGVSVDVIRSVWNVMEACPQHVFQILTKRPERMNAVVHEERLKPSSHIWLGVSVESCEYSDRIRWLQDTPAGIRFVSFEPLLGPIGALDLQDVHWAIVGGESGPGARPIQEEWVSEIQAQCTDQSVAFFFKQWGGKNKKAAGRVLRGRTWEEYPRSLASIGE
jgi:protein gp37